MKEYLQGQMKGMKEDLQEQIDGIHYSVSKIEIEHGEKIQMLCDSLVIGRETNQKIDRLQKTVDGLKFGDEVIRLVNYFENETQT
jgi:hypothetical protein